MSYTRAASHAAPNGGGWYEAIPDSLKRIVDDYFSHASTPALPGTSRLMGIISPHAGLSYSGGVASTAYAAVRDYLYGVSSPTGTRVQRVFILGPSHHKGFRGVELSAARTYESPFGPVQVDTETVTQLRADFATVKVAVGVTDQRTDEAEHSIEMQMPFLSHVLHFPPPGAAPAITRVKMVPIIVGWTDRKAEENMQAVLKPYMEDPGNLFVFSSDFCHWGSRFDYMFHYKQGEYPNIGDSIIAMDHEGMDTLQTRNADSWYQYLDATENTICGRHAIGAGVNWWGRKDVHGVEVQFVDYAQSNKCASKRDSSVSYASAIVTQVMA